MSKAHALKDLQRIPGVGPSIAEDLFALGIYRVEDLRGKDADVLYEQLCAQVGQRVDRCMLYVFRCAIYFASHAQHDEEKLKWWNWKDAN
jgi:nucleotidyltransferase/DNA polymerase involved in DNA repair